MSKIWFLSKCYQNKVIPKILRIRTTPPRELSNKAVLVWKSVQDRQQLQYINIAQRELVKQDLAKQKDNLNRSMVTLYDSIKDIELKVMLNEKMEVSRRSATTQCNNDHRQKLRTLLTSAGKEILPTLHRSAKSSLSLQSGLISNLSILNETPSILLSIQKLLYPRIHQL